MYSVFHKKTATTKKESGKEVTFFLCMTPLNYLGTPWESLLQWCRKPVGGGVYLTTVNVQSSICELEVHK